MTFFLITIFLLSVIMLITMCSCMAQKTDSGSLLALVLALGSIVIGCMLTIGIACNTHLVPSDIYKNMAIIDDGPSKYIVIKGQSNGGIYFVRANKDIQESKFYKIESTKFVPYEFETKETE